MSFATLEGLTDGAFFEKSPIAIAIAQRVREEDKGADLSLAIAIVKELDYWLNTNSGKVVNAVRWVWKTYKDWWKEHFPYQNEYRVRRALDALKNTGILLFEQWDKAKFRPTAYWRVNYDLLESFTQRCVPENKPQSQSLSSSKPETLTHDVVWTVHTAISTTTSSSSTLQIPSPTPPQEGEEGDTKETDNSTAQETNTDSLAEPQKIEQNLGTMQSNPEDRSSVKSQSVRVRVVDSRLGFGDGTNAALERRKEWARKSRIPTYSDREYEFSKAFSEWEALKGVKFSQLSKTLDLVRGGAYVVEWDEFNQGLPLGTLNKRDWESLRGIPHPMFVEHVARQLQGTGKTFAQALDAARWQINDAAFAQKHFEDWGRRVINAKDESDRLRAMGVTGDTMPVDLKPLRTPGIDEIATSFTQLVMEQPSSTIAQVVGAAPAQSTPKQLCPEPEVVVEQPEVAIAAAPVVEERSLDYQGESERELLERLKTQFNSMRSHLQSGKTIRSSIAIKWVEIHGDYIELIRDENNNPIDIDWRF